MSFKMKTQMKLAQHICMSQELQQAINLLSLNHEEIKDLIKEEILENPVLKTEGQEETVNKTEFKWELDGYSFEKNTSPEKDQASEKAEAPSTTESLIDSFLENNKSNESDEAYKQNSYSGWDHEQKPIIDWETIQSHPYNLQDHLLWQVRMSSLTEEKKTLAAFLICNLSEQGYLRSSVEDIATKESVCLKKLEQALLYVQTLDPIGVGAKDLQDCLLIQLRFTKEDDPLTKAIISTQFTNLKNKKYKLIASILSASLEEVLESCKKIQSLNPFPTKDFSNEPIQYITPDACIYKEDGDYKVSLNNEDLPELRIDKYYKKMLSKKGSCPIDMKQYVRTKLERGHWFIRSIHQRQQTVRKVVESIAKHQRDFLEKGPMFIKPLLLADIAQDISVHPSTVSRATNNKYIQSPQGLLPMKYFFSQGIANRRGVRVSSLVIQEYVKYCIQNEDQQHPISDGQIAKKIAVDLNLNLSRRIIVRYRDLCAIPNALIRKNQMLL